MIRMEGLWNVHAWLANACLEDFTDAEWRARPAGANSALWLLGHILSTRKYLARVLGLAVPESPAERHFGAGSKPDDVPPDIDGKALLAEFAAFHAEFLRHLGGMSETDLGHAIEDSFPMMPSTRLGALQFLLTHEAYHLGQLGLLRVQLGKGSWMSKMA